MSIHVVATDKERKTGCFGVQGYETQTEKKTSDVLIGSGYMNFPNTETLCVARDMNIVLRNTCVRFFFFFWGGKDHAGCSTQARHIAYIRSLLSVQYARAFSISITALLMISLYCDPFTRIMKGLAC